MIYLSKGILPWRPNDMGVSVSHCGTLHKLTGLGAELWLAGQYEPGHTRSTEQETALIQLAELGIVEYAGDSGNMAVFRLLTNCVICPVRAKASPVLLTRSELRVWQWVKKAGLRLTIAELTLLSERGTEPIPALLGEQNRQALTETIYTADTIFDGILETMMEKSPAMDGTVRTVLGLLRKRKIFLI